MKAKALNRHFRPIDDVPALLRYEARLHKVYEDILEFAARRAAERFPTFAKSESLAASTPGVGTRTAMVAVYPSAEQAAMLAVSGGEEPDVIHCTLAFLGEIEPDQEAAVVAALQKVAEQHTRGSLSGEVGGVASFGDNGNGFPSILLPDVDGLAELRHAVVEALDEAGIERMTNHGWTPHLTLSYAEEPSPPSANLIGYGLDFDALSIAVGNVRRDFEFGGGLTAGAVVAESEVGKKIGEVAAKYGPDSAPDYGDCWWNEAEGKVYWITADYTGNEALEAAPAEFLAIEGVESVEDCDECGAPEEDGWEFVYDNSGTAAVIAAAEADLAAGRTVALSAAGDPPPPPWTQPHPDELVNVDELIERFRGKSDPIRKALVKERMAPALEEAGLDFDTTNPLIAGAYAKTGQHITYIAETTRLNAMRIVRRSYEEGLSIPSTADALREGMMAASATRATLIARTEMTSLVNGASLAAAQVIDGALSEARDAGEEDAQDFAGYQKRWLTAPGAHFPRHEDYDGLDGQTVPLEAPFEVGGVQMMYPGDPDGPPEEVCNCRCTIVLVDASGADAEEDPGAVGLEAAAGTPLPFSDDEGGTAVRDRAKKDKSEETIVADASADSDAASPNPSDSCSNCSHAAELHAGETMSGSCDQDGCDCGAFVPKDESPAPDPENDDDEYVAGEGMSIAVRIRPDMTGAKEAIAAGVAEAVTEGLSRVTFAAEGQSAVVEERPARTTGAEADIEPPTVLSSRQGWHAMLAPEGKTTDDGRVFAPGSITWRDLPLSLMAMTETPAEGGHAGAELAGRIDRIYRVDDTPLPYWIVGDGEFDNGDYGEEIARLVGDQTLRGNSVDLAIHRAEFLPRDVVVDENGIWRDDAPAEGEYPEPSIDDLFSGDLIMVVRAAVIGMSTVCPFPAFADANIVLASGMGVAIEGAIGAGRCTIYVEDAFQVENVLTASAEGLAPLKPPTEWFERPELDELTPLTIDEDGRVYGHAWSWETCHIGFPGACVTAPHSRTDYAYFHLKEVECDDGARVDVGTITLGTGHADQRAGREAATAHYDHTGTAVADVRIYEDEFGGVVAGALRSDVAAGRVREFRGSTPSGDWRKVNGNLELVGLLAVNVPGFPVPRTKALVASAGEDGNAEVFTLLAAGLLERSTAGVGEIEYLDDGDRAKLAALAARATGGLKGLATLARSRPARSKPRFVTAAAVWDSENGVMDVMADIASALNPGDAWRFYVVDLSVGGDSAIIADVDENAYYLVALTYEEGEPVLPPMSEWQEVESEWVTSQAGAAHTAFLARRLADLAARVA